MREGAILSVLVNPQVPDNRGKQDNRGFHEEVTLFLYPGLVQIEHDCVGAFIGVADVGHELRVDGIAPVGTAGIVEIDNIKFRLHLVFIHVLQQFIVSDNGADVKFVVVDIDRKALGNLLFDIVLMINLLLYLLLKLMF